MMTDSSNKIRGSTIEAVKSMSCEFVVTNFKKYSKYKAINKISSALSLYSKNILLNQIVHVNSRISLSLCKLAKVYGITHVHIHNISTKNIASSGVVTESTKIHIVSVHSEEFNRLSLEIENLPELAGLDTEFEKVEKLFYINRSITKFYRPHGVLLHGPPGCGKSSFGKSFARKCAAIFYNVDSSSLLSSDFGSGANALKNIFQKAISLIEEGPVILFLDEIDTLCPRQEVASLGNRQLSNALMNEMDAMQSQNISGLLVLAATNSISSVDPHLRRPGRFDQEILINVPTEVQRLSIIQVTTAHLCLASDVSCKTLAQMTPGFVGADLKSLCEEAISHAHNKNSQESPVISMEDFDYALHKTIPSLKKGAECVVDLKPVKWAEIGSLDDVKAELKQSIEWPLKYPDVLRKMDIPPPKGILLYGPPGCCKTTLVRAAATSCNVTFLSLSGAQVYSAYVGESERLISQAFQKARALAPSILFFDEMESLVGKRMANVGNNRVQERILSTMLNEMDGVGNKLDFKMDSTTVQADGNGSAMQKTLGNNMNDTSFPAELTEYSNSSSLRVIVVGATNRPDMLDPAILRPGRLDKHIYVPPPDAQARKTILEIFTSKMSCTDVDIDSLVGKTDLYSGADLKNLCKEAGLQAVRGQLASSKSIDNQHHFVITDHHFQQALEKIKPSLTQEILLEYRK